jgi:hypothetical protein
MGGGYKLLQLKLRNDQDQTINARKALYLPPIQTSVLVSGWETDALISGKGIYGGVIRFLSGVSSFCLYESVIEPLAGPTLSIPLDMSGAASLSHAKLCRKVHTLWALRPSVG